MQKYWRPGLRVWWRCDGEAQLGLDPPAILFGLSHADHQLLEALAHADPQLDCWSVAQRLGWTRTSFTQFLRRLPPHALVDAPTAQATAMRDRKSTRLNSSHVAISYAVFCLKKKRH